MESPRQGDRHDGRRGERRAFHQGPGGRGPLARLLFHEGDGGERDRHGDAREQGRGNRFRGQGHLFGMGGRDRDPLLVGGLIYGRHRKEHRFVGRERVGVAGFRGSGERNQSVYRNPIQQSVGSSSNKGWKQNDDGTFTVGPNSAIISAEDFSNWLDAFESGDTKTARKIENSKAMKDAKNKAGSRCSKNDARKRIPFYLC